MISVQNLDFSFGKKKVFQNLDLHIEQGQICGLFGKNGIGKTTLMYNLAGLLFPNKGKINVLGFEPKKRETNFLKELFVIPDEVYLPNTSVSGYQKTMSVFYPKFNLEQFERYLTNFEIAKHQKLDEMSYGQRKKVFIAMALASNTSVVLMDEPTNGLDIMGKTQFKKIMAEIIDDNRVFIISTHQAKDLENLIDRIIILDEEKVLFNQNIQQISEKLSFKIASEKSEIEKAFYSEDNFLGNILILPNEENTENQVDLELLYKAILSNPERINNWFNSNK